jgi:5'-nucleotidase
MIPFAGFTIARSANMNSIRRCCPAGCLSILLAIVAAGCARAVAPAPAAAATTIDVRLIALNDFHGYIDPPADGLKLPAAGGAGTVTLRAGGAAALAGEVARLRTGHPRNLVVAAGDLVGASPLDSGAFHDEPAILAMNALGLDLSAVGNHEFDKGRAELLRKQRGGCLPGGTPGRDTCVDGNFAGARYHYLAANVIDETTGKPLFPPYEIRRFDADGRKLAIAFIGLVLHETPSMVTPAGVAGLRFTNEAAAANALVPQIRALGANAIVVLIHQGAYTAGTYNDKSCPNFRGDIQPILDALDPAIRVVVSGHTHQAYNCTVGGRLVTSAGSYGRFLTAIDLALDRNSGAIVEATADNVPVVDVGQPAADAYPPAQPDPQVADLVSRYDAIAAPIVGRVIGHIDLSLSRESDIDAGASGESPLGDCVADSMLAAARQAGTGAVAAFENSGGIRSDLVYEQPGGGHKPGDVTYGDAYNVLPFGNNLVAMSLTGEQLYALLAQQWSGRRPRIFQVSRGFGYAWKTDRVTGGGAVVPGSVKIDGLPVRPEGRYRVAVNDFMAAGGDGYTVLKDGGDRVGFGADIDAFAGYLGSASPLPMPRLERIIRQD